MSAPTRLAYPAEPGIVGMARDGARVMLTGMTADAAADLGPKLAAIDPWARVAYSGENFTAFLATVEQGARRYVIEADGQRAGVMVVRVPWLHGPYLHLLGLLPGHQGRGIGDVALRWLESEAAGRHRNVWLCVSAFNTGARRFYEKHGFAQAGVLDSLVFDGMDEILMRKRVV